MFSFFSSSSKLWCFVSLKDVRCSFKLFVVCAVNWLNYMRSQWIQYTHHRARAHTHTHLKTTTQEKKCSRAHIPQIYDSLNVLQKTNGTKINWIEYALAAAAAAQHNEWCVCWLQKRRFYKFCLFASIFLRCVFCFAAHAFDTREILWNGVDGRIKWIFCCFGFLQKNKCSHNPCELWLANICFFFNNQI